MIKGKIIKQYSIHCPLCSNQHVSIRSQNREVFIVTIKKYLGWQEHDGNWYCSDCAYKKRHPEEAPIAILETDQ